MIEITKEQFEPAEKDLMKILLAYIKDNKKKIKTDIFDEISNSSDYDAYIDDEGHEILGDFLGKTWQSYYSDGYRKTVIVKNVKGKGFPDFEDVLDKVEKQLPEGVTREDLEGYCTTEFLDGLFWDDKQFIIEETIIPEYPNFVAVGRSGGYWGLDVDIYDTFTLDDRVVDKKTDKILDNFEKLLNGGKIIKFGITTVVEDFFYDETPISIDHNALIDVIFDEVLGKDVDVTLASMLLLSEKTKVMFEELNKLIEDIIKSCEDSQTWVDTIIANQYWGINSTFDEDTEIDADFYEGKKINLQT